MHEIAEFLRQHPPFDALSDDDLEQLAAACEIEFAPAGSVLLEQAASPSQFVWVVRRGAVSATVTGSTYTVKFNKDVSKCSYTASPVGSAATEAIGVQAATAADSVTVNTGAPGPGSFHLQVIC